MVVKKTYISIPDDFRQIVAGDRRIGEDIDRRRKGYLYMTMKNYMPTIDMGLDHVFSGEYLPPRELEDITWEFNGKRSYPIGDEMLRTSAMNRDFDVFYTEATPGIYWRRILEWENGRLPWKTPIAFVFMGGAYNKRLEEWLLENVEIMLSDYFEDLIDGTMTGKQREALKDFKREFENGNLYTENASELFKKFIEDTPSLTEAYSTHGLNAYTAYKGYDFVDEGMRYGKTIYYGLGNDATHYALPVMYQLYVNAFTRNFIEANRENFIRDESGNYRIPYYDLELPARRIKIESVASIWENILLPVFKENPFYLGYADAVVDPYNLMDFPLEGNKHGRGYVFYIAKSSGLADLNTYNKESNYALLNE